MWDHAKVVEMSGWWQEAGLGETSSGRFLKSLAATGNPPFGRGTSWLEDLIRQGDPRPSAALGSELEKLIPTAGADADTLVRMVANLKAGYPPKDWYRDFIARLQQKSRSGTTRLPTPEDVKLARDISVYKSGQSMHYWSRKPGTSNKIDKITHTILNNGAIYQEDVDYLLNNFKSLVKMITRRDLDGKLSWLKISNIMSEETRFRIPGPPESTIPVIMMGQPFVDPTLRRPVIKGLADSKPVLVLCTDTVM